MTEIPHLSFPVRLAGGSYAVDEQDSVEELQSCVAVIAGCVIGEREELPAFGVENLLGETIPLDLDSMRANIEKWEPRSSPVLDEHGDTIDEAVRNITIAVDKRE